MFWQEEVGEWDSVEVFRPPLEFSYTSRSSGIPLPSYPHLPCIYFYIHELPSLTSSAVRTSRT